jgi:hypothetical protein
MKTVKQDRILALSSKLFKQDDHFGQESVRGFTSNPLADSITAAQLLIYQAAYRQALKALQEREWRRMFRAECWN